MTGMDMSDSELAVLAGGGDAEAYRRLFERYQHPIYNFVYRLVGNAEDASDIVQNAFLKIYTLLGQKEIENFSAYLYRIAKNLAYDEMRRRSRFADVDHELLAPEDPNIYADPQRALLLGEQIGKVRQAVENLNENQRAALILRELQDLDYDEMAEVLESNRNAVGALLSRARLKFREELRMVQVLTEEAPPDCEECIALLSPYIDGELKPEKKGWVESHLEDCTFCMAALDEMREASRSFRMFIPVIPPADMAQAFTGRLGELAGQGAGGMGDGMAGQSDSNMYPQDGTMGASGQGAAAAPGKRSLFSRMLHSRLAWIIIAGMLIFIPAGLLLAEETAGDRDLFGSNPAPVSTITNSRTTTIRSETTNADDAAAATTVETPAATDTPGVETTPSSGATSAPVKVLTGSVSPGTAYPRQPIKLASMVSGKAISVTVNLAPQSGGSASVHDLALQSESSGNEVWGATGYAPAAGNYYIYIQATNADGQVDSLYAGMLVVYQMVY
ncbi:MAG: sigma-70 family RNA polymerase sigma factor [Thermoleophilia bacterium]